jgi:hypothetical protein
MGTSEEEKFVEDSFAEIDQMKLDELKNNADITKILAASKDTFETIDINGVVIKFKPFLTRKLRQRFFAAQKSEVTPDLIDAVVYDTLADLCIETPWNQRETWIGIETLGGDVQGILKKMIAKITENSSKTRDFRPNQ